MPAGFCFREIREMNAVIHLTNFFPLAGRRNFNFKQKFYVTVSHWLQLLEFGALLFNCTGVLYQR